MKKTPGIWAILTAAFVMITAMTVMAQPAVRESGTIKSIDMPDIRFELKEGSDRARVETNCMICHSTDYIPMQPVLTRKQWTATVDKMIKTFGAPVSPEYREKIINYLVAAYGKEQ
jgi:hypothetical protein